MLKVPLKDLYLNAEKSNSPVFSLEFFPPKKAENLSKTKNLIADLAEFPVAYMTVTYGAGGSTRSFTKELASFIHQKLKKRAICHLTCVDHSADEISELLRSFQDLGISDVLALRGDPPAGVDAIFEAHPQGFSCARDLISFIHSKFPFSICAAGYPEGHRDSKSVDEDIMYLKQKVEAGAQVIITQLFFNPDVYFHYVERCKSVGITVPIVPGVMPVRDYHQLQRFTQMCGATIPESLQHKLEILKDDSEALINFGTEYATNLCRTLIAGGAPGIHLYTLNQSDQVRSILADLL